MLKIIIKLFLFNSYYLSFPDRAFKPEILKTKNYKIFYGRIKNRTSNN
jgi:hypothetical protein